MNTLASAPLNRKVYTVAWAVWKHVSGELYVNMNYVWHEQPRGTADLAIVRTEEGFYVTPEAQSTPSDAPPYYYHSQAQIKACYGPTVGLISAWEADQRDWLAEYEAALAEGNKAKAAKILKLLLPRLQKALSKAVESEEYETAAKLKAQLQALN